MPNELMLKFYSNFISKGNLCFDIGANIGNRTETFLQLQSKVIAVEPQNDCVEFLKKNYGTNPDLVVIQKILGEKECETEMFLCNFSPLSSVSNSWMEAVKKSGRFSKYNWSKKQPIQMTTLDKLISEYGKPSFIKVDVEGSEYEVMKGLSQPIKMISLEFTPEFLDSTYLCLGHLSRLGVIQLNLSIGESMRLELGNWVSQQEMITILSRYKNNVHVFGDVYVKSLID